jgi:ectoine hydrolase
MSQDQQVKSMQLFSRAEYRRRLSEVKQKMVERGIDIFIDADPADIFYLTGYRGMSYYTQQCVIVSLADETPFVFTRAMDAPAVQLQSWLEESQMIAWPDAFANADDANPFSFLGEVFKSRSWDRLVIGVEEDAGMYSPRDDRALKQNLPASGFKDASSLVRLVRRIKSDDEIRLMKEAARISERAMAAGIHGLLNSERECDVIAQIYRASVSAVDGKGGDYPANPPMMPSGNNISNPHLTWTDDPLPSSGSVTLELSGARHRYHAPMARTIFLGNDKPPRMLIDVSNAAIEGLNETLSRSKPGMTAGEIFAVWDHYNKKYDLRKDSRIGYGIGCAFPPSWLERTTSIRADNPTPIVEGMTFHIIIGIWRNDISFEVSEAVVMTDQGFQKLSDFDQNLVVR